MCQLGSITMWSPVVHFGRRPSSCQLLLCLRRNWVICRHSSATKFKTMCSPLTKLLKYCFLDHASREIYFFSCYLFLYMKPVMMENSMNNKHIKNIVSFHFIGCKCKERKEKQNTMNTRGQGLCENIWKGHSVHDWNMKRQRVWSWQSIEQHADNGNILFQAKQALKWM